MSDIPPIGASANVVFTPSEAASPAGVSSVATLTADTVEISELAQILSTLGSPASEIRADKVAAIREAIQNGTYETEDKLDLALDRLIDVLRSPEHQSI